MANMESHKAEKSPSPHQHLPVRASPLWRHQMEESAPSSLSGSSWDCCWRLSQQSVQLSGLAGHQLKPLNQIGNCSWILISNLLYHIFLVIHEKKNSEILQLLVFLLIKYSQIGKQVFISLLRGGYLKGPVILLWRGNPFVCESTLSHLSVCPYILNVQWWFNLSFSLLLQCFFSTSALMALLMAWCWCGGHWAPSLHLASSLHCLCPAMGLKNQQRLNQQRGSLGFLVHFCTRLEQFGFIWIPPHLCRRATLRQRGLPSPIYRKIPLSGENMLQSDYLILVLSIRCNCNHLVKVYCFPKAGTMQGLGSVVGDAFLEAHDRIGF